MGNRFMSKLKRSTFEILFNYGQEDECLFEVSVGWDAVKGELQMYYVYDLEAAEYERVEYWQDAAWSRFRHEIIKKLRVNENLTDAEFYN